jgi:hypothetical protein
LKIKPSLPSSSSSPPLLLPPPPWVMYAEGWATLHLTALNQLLGYWPHTQTKISQCNGNVFSTVGMNGSGETGGPAYRSGSGWHVRSWVRTELWAASSQGWGQHGQLCNQLCYHFSHPNHSQILSCVFPCIMV